jgi:hypothetical protein
LAPECQQPGLISFNQPGDKQRTTNPDEISSFLAFHGVNNEQQTPNNEQQTTNTKQRTTNNKQRTTNNEQRTTNTEHQTPVK